MRPTMPLLLSIFLTAGLAAEPLAEAGNPVRQTKKRDAKKPVKKPGATTRPNARTRTSATKPGARALRRTKQQDGQQARRTPTNSAIKKFGSTRSLVKSLLRGVRVKGVDANDPANGWGIPADAEWKDYIGFVQEAEAKFQVAPGADRAIERSMGNSDFTGLFGSDVGSQLSGAGLSIVKQSRDQGPTQYADIYYDAGEGSPIATESGISVRHRQIGDQIGTEAGMFEVKLYTSEGDNGPVQDRLEIRKRTNDNYKKSDLLARKTSVGGRDLRQQNPLHYLGKAVQGRGKQLERLKNTEFAPFISIKQNRVEYNLRDQAGRSLYLVTLDRVTGSYAGDAPRKTKSGKTVKKGDSAKHNELEVEQMFNSADPAFHDVLSQLSGQKVDAGNADAIAKKVLTRMTTAMESAVSGLSRSDRNKPGIVAQNLGLVD